MTTTVMGTWTGRETALLRSALRLSMRAFAEHLGVATRTVAKWEARGEQIQPVPDMQSVLDTALQVASDEVRERFSTSLNLDRTTPPTDQVDDGSSELAVRLAWAGSALDADLVALFERQTQAYRLLDRRLGAHQLLTQTEGHVVQMTQVLAYSLDGPHRCALAAALAEAAALAGWQALDLGQPDRAWLLHERARSAAAQSGDSAVIAHVCAQQAYALLDVDRPDAAVDQVRHARQSAGTRIPATLRAWLWAAEAEALAGTGCETGARTAIDHAVQLIGRDEAQNMPYLALEAVHLSRWRGHCLARLDGTDAIDDLSLALKTLDPSFVRATAGVHCDLAIAYGVRREWDAARDHAKQAAGLAAATMSIRQQRRIRQLVMC